MYSLPVADTGDRSEGVTITSRGVEDVPPTLTTTTSTIPDDSVPVNCPSPKSITTTKDYIIKQKYLHNACCNFVQYLHVKHYYDYNKNQLMPGCNSMTIEYVT